MASINFVGLARLLVVGIFCTALILLMSSGYESAQLYPHYSIWGPCTTYKDCNAMCINTVGRKQGGFCGIDPLDKHCDCICRDDGPPTEIPLPAPCKP
ncbi:unnamed protein product [Malus baccata var. baccata]